MKILCIADSLALPRPGVSYNETWIALLKEQFNIYDFITIFRRNLTTDFFYESWEEDSLEFYTPNIVILQLGIVDCAPRYIKHSSALFKIINQSPPLVKNIIWWLIKKTKKRNLKQAEVPLERFHANLLGYIKRCHAIGVEKIIIIKICTPGPKMITHNPGITTAVYLYNNIIENIAQNNSKVVLLDPLSISQDDLYVDGYHPNKKGHLLVYNSLQPLINAKHS